MNSARHITLGLALLWSFLAKSQVDLRDTIAIYHNRQRIQEFLDLSQLDSARKVVLEDLQLLEEILARPEVQGDNDVLNAVLRLKAYAKVGQGASEPDVGVLGPFEEAVEIFRGLGDKRGEAYTYVQQADRTEDMGGYFSAIHLLRDAIFLYKGLGDELELARASNAAGVYYRVMGDPSTALQYHLDALPVIEATGNHGDIGWCYILLGAVHRATREPYKAIPYFDKAREHFLQQEDSVLLGYALNDLGSVYQMAEEYETAIAWHRQAAALRKRLGSLDGYGHSMQYLGEIFHINKQYDKSIAHLHKAIDSYGNVPMPGSMARCYGRIADIYFETGRQDTALIVMEQAVELMERFKDRQFMPMLIYRWADMLRSAGKHDEALEANERGLAESQRQQDLFEQARGHRQLLENHTDLNNHRKAYQHHVQMMAAYDSSERSTQSSKVLQVMLKHDLEQLKIKERSRDEALRITQQQNLQSRTRQKYFYIAGGSLLALLALGLAGRVNYSARSKKRLERQRRELKRAIIRAEQSEKFKERFLANMSHEVRTPMNAIMGMGKILGRNEHLPEQEVYLNAIGESAENLLQIINDILDFSKLDANRLELEITPMDIGVLTQELVNELKEKYAQQALEISCVISDDIPKALFGDPTRFRQIMQNLVQNAIKFTDLGFVRVQLSVAAETLGATTVQAEVRDSGRGIAAERLPSIFEEFNKAYADGKRKYGGSGLGLALTKRLVELMGGNIKVQSIEGSGSTFTIKVPFEIAGTQTQVEASESKPLKDLRILLADDNAFNIMVAQDELEDAIPGVTVQVANNGRQALELANEQPFDLVLMDVQMPEMNGYEATQAIRDLGGKVARTPIIAMTANGMESEVKRCLEAGMDGFVPKPFRRDELLQKIALVLKS